MGPRKNIVGTNCKHVYNDSSFVLIKKNFHSINRVATNFLLRGNKVKIHGPHRESRWPCGGRRGRSERGGRGGRRRSSESR